MKAYLEPVAFVLRVVSREASEATPMPHPYIGSATITLDEEGIATVRGLTMKEPMDVDAWRAITRALVRIGAKGMVYSRKVDGENRSIVRRELPGAGPLYL